MSKSHTQQRNQRATCYCGNLDLKVTEELLWELMLQVGPIESVYIPTDKVTATHQSYGFVEFRGEADADYAVKVMNMVKLFGKPIRVSKTSQDKKDSDIGANLFVGNLAPEVDESLMYNTFTAFGGLITTPTVMRDPDTGAPKGYGFVKYDSFEAADMAIECMNGQYLCNRPITVQFAFKRDSRSERHGSQAERLLAARDPHIQAAAKMRPHTMFASQAGTSSNIVPVQTRSAMIGAAHQFQPPLPSSNNGGVRPPPPPPPSSGGNTARPPPPPPPSNFMRPPPPPPPSSSNFARAPPPPPQMMMMRPPPYTQPPPPGQYGQQLPPMYARLPPQIMMMRPPPPQMMMRPPPPPQMMMRPPRPPPPSV